MISHFQNEKCHLLVEHETQKLKELDEEHSQELKEWREKLRPRKKVKLQFEKYGKLNRMLYLEEKYLVFLYSDPVCFNILIQTSYWKKCTFL